jgi:hypothetical protein
MYLTKAAHRGTTMSHEPDETAGLDAPLSEADYNAFLDMMLDWATTGDTPYVLREGGVGDTRDLARRCLRWAASLPSMRRL